MKINENIKSILQNWQLDWNKYYLPQWLDRKDYLKVNEILESIWFLWNRKLKSHVNENFNWNLDDLINIFNQDEVKTKKDIKKETQFFETPKEVVDLIYKEIKFNNWDNVLEPSAGRGNLIKNLNLNNITLTLVELDKDNYSFLQENYNNKNVSLYNKDFLEFNQWNYDKIIANPPFAKSQDVKHILHMYELLKEGGILVSVASSSITIRTWKLYDELRNLNPIFIEIPEESFKSSWTLVNTVLVVLQK
jgi:phospholipid N-methyltransferase